MLVVQTLFSFFLSSFFFFLSLSFVCLLSIPVVVALYYYYQWVCVCVCVCVWVSVCVCVCVWVSLRIPYSPPLSLSFSITFGCASELLKRCSSESKKGLFMARCACAKTEKGALMNFSVRSGTVSHLIPSCSFLNFSVRSRTVSHLIPSFSFLVFSCLFFPSLSLPPLSFLLRQKCACCLVPSDWKRAFVFVSLVVCFDSFSECLQSILIQLFKKKNKCMFIRYMRVV